MTKINLSETTKAANELFKSMAMPERISRLDTYMGYPVPWFVQYIGNVPDFRVMDMRKYKAALQFKYCWICGEKLGTRFTFVAGPMCSVERVAADPPSHRDCAYYAARTCPFLSNPKMERREEGLPKERSCVGGHMITRNPGVAMLWHTRSYKVEIVRNGQILIMGNPEGVEWFREGRYATRAEVLESFESGYPELKKAVVARNEVERREMLEGLDKYYQEALQLIPGE